MSEKLRNNLQVKAILKCLFYLFESEINVEIFMIIKLTSKILKRDQSLQC